MQIFSLSALDIFASAMGTFILIAVVLFPYYMKNQTVIRTLNKAAGTIETIKRKIKSAEGQERAAKADAEKARAQARKWRAQAKSAGGPMTLPKGGRNPKSLEFARGCWKTDPFRHSPRHKEGVSQYCFNKAGQGNLLYHRTAEKFVCAALASIQRNGEQIVIRDTDARCNIDQADKGVWHADRLVCRPDASGVVWCQGGSASGATWRVRLFRQ